MTRTTVLLLTALLVVSAVPAPASGQSTEQVTLTISVVDKNGDGVAGATVTATWDGGNETQTTRANGQTLVDVPRGATVEMTVQSDEYVRNTPYTIESAESGEVEVSVAQKGSATVEVTNTRGEPVTDAIVRLWQDGTRIVNARTNSNGVHQTPEIEQGEYNLFVFKEGYRRNRTDLQVNGSVNASLAIEQGSVTATFNVTDNHFSPAEPVENASIDVAGVASNVRTPGSGEIILSVPVNNQYDVTVSKQGYQTTTEQLTVGESATGLNATIRRTPAISIDSLASQVVVGQNTSIDVTDEYGTPVGNATIALDGETIGRTDSNGELTFAVGSAGNHTITATADGLESSATIQAFSPDSGEETTDDAGVTETDAAETTQSSGGGPGFTAMGALVATLLAVALLARD